MTPALLPKKIQLVLSGMGHLSHVWETESVSVVQRTILVEVHEPPAEMDPSRQGTQRHLLNEDTVYVYDDEPGHC